MYFPDEVLNYRVALNVGQEVISKIVHADGENGYRNTLYDRLNKIEGISNTDYDGWFVGADVTVTIDEGHYNGEKLAEIHRIITEYIKDVEVDDE